MGIDDSPLYHPSQTYFDPFSEEMNDDMETPEEYEERMEEERAETAGKCTCGAWIFTKSGSPVQSQIVFAGPINQVLNLNH